ncbi:hypothetical protein DEO23_14780 [Brachybacterium endophyticum]|uniref:Uncharacterized protein n=1 Tax=Brachybacterium endophyticum TaxID=2182385 RepID=A0A2U2RGR6_9MICO|nr:hypothetical protein [Brachybacterium endophyticum]PWH05062.1 hypothetical protein DEO23_14780 [Brachybacterium endophyticum]
MTDPRAVHDSQELLQAVEEGVSDIEVAATISGLPRMVLGPGTRLHGGRLEFESEGLQLTRDAALEDLEIIAPPHEVAVGVDTDQETWGTLALRGVTVVGQVALIAAGAVTSGHIEIGDLTIREADLRDRRARPRFGGDEAVQGALTIWNQQDDDAVQITARIENVRAGTEESPVRGSGVVLAGRGRDGGATAGGRLAVSSLSTGAIVTDGGLVPDGDGLLSAGVLVLDGAVLGAVAVHGTVTTHGPFDVALANAGGVMMWTVDAPLTTYGPGAIGIANRGDIGTLEVDAPVHTSGDGACAVDLHAGTLIEVALDSVLTRGDGATGVQISHPLPTLSARGDIATEGGAGDCTMDDTQSARPGSALRLTQGGGIEVLEVGGQIRTAGDDVVSVDLGSAVGSWNVAGGVVASGARSRPVRRAPGIAAPAAGSFLAADGRDVIDDA